jgi:hypothetical protein
VAVVPWARLAALIDPYYTMVLSRLRSGLPTHLCSPSFKGQGAFSTQ